MAVVSTFDSLIRDGIMDLATPSLADHSVLGNFNIQTDIASFTLNQDRENDMSESPGNALLQEIFNSGSYEKAHDIITRGADALSEDVVAVLESDAMRLFDENDPDLAAIFMELAVLASTVLGSNRAKGRAQYAKGTLLERMKRYEDALGPMFDAHAYFRAAGAHQLLANCLFDTARCFAQLGREDTAIALLEESIAYQPEEKDRNDARAFIFSLAMKKGALATERDIEALTARLQAVKRELVVGEVVEPAERRSLCERLVQADAAGGFTQDPLFEPSLDRLARDPRYRFFVADDVIAGSPYAFGIMKPYDEPFNGRAVMGVEAIAFTDADHRAHERVIAALSTFCARFRVRGLCLSAKSVGVPAIAAEILTAFHLDDWPLTLLRGTEPGVYSAFAETPADSRCVCLRVEVEPLDFSGVVVTGVEPLYRGEGRARCLWGRQTWDFGEGSDGGHLDALAARFFAEGFRGRAVGEFSGSVQDQLLHQGYVPCPTVSLSRSEKVCAYYATDRHQRPGGGLVFVIDPAIIAREGRVFDSLATLQRHNPWLAGNFLQVIRDVVRALDGELGDVRVSGAFLEMCHRETRRRVESFGGGSLGPAMDWDACVDPRALAKLEAAGVPRATLDAIVAEFELFWSVALGQTVSMDRIDALSGAARTEELSQAYFRAFDEVRLRLKEAWTRNKLAPHNHPGWDISPFGYVAKTIRDQELFSSGDIPGACIVEARVVDREGRTTRVIRNK